MSLTVLADKEDHQTPQPKSHSSQDPSALCNSQKEADERERKKYNLHITKKLELVSG